MGFFGSMFRFVRTLFGLAEGGTQRATDNLLTSSPDAIRNQFRKTREDWIKDYNQVKDAVAELCNIRDQKATEIQRLSKSSHLLDDKMAGAIELFKKTQDQALRIRYGEMSEEKIKNEKRIDELEAEVHQQEAMIENYKAQLLKLQNSIDELKQEEAATVADIVSSRKIAEITGKLDGLTTDTQTKNLEAIREARLKAKSMAKLSDELSGTIVARNDQQLLSAGVVSKHLDEFDAAVKFDNFLPASKSSVILDAEHIEVADNNVSKLDNLFK